MIKKLICWLWGHKRNRKVLEYVPRGGEACPRWMLEKLHDCPRCGAELIHIVVDNPKAKENGDE